MLHCTGKLLGKLTFLLALALAVSLAACGPSWQITVSEPNGDTFLVDSAVLGEYEDFAESVGERQAIPVERILTAAGHEAVESLRTVAEDGSESSFEWASVADDAWWLGDGSLLLSGDNVRASRVEVEPPVLLDEVEASIVDIAPTISAALSLPAPSQATGTPLAVPAADRVALMFLDGFGYVRYTEALADGLIPNLGSLGEPLVAVTTYPPITSVSTASLLTGAPPEVHGVDQRGIRKTDTETLFDVAAAAGLKIAAVEGESLSFELRGAQLQLSADLDGNGTTDDNVLTNALRIMGAGGPDILFVHFHGIDDAGHTYGPGAPEESSAIEEVDSAVGRIVDLLPEGTLVVIVADHGMHEVHEEGRLGNHGHLLERDMLIPIFQVGK